MHAVPDVAQLDLWIDGERRIAGLAQREGSPLTPCPSAITRSNCGRPGRRLLTRRCGAAASLLRMGSACCDGIGTGGGCPGAVGSTRLAVVAAKLSDAQPSGLLLRGLHASPALLGLQVANTLGREPLPVFNLSPAVLSPAVDVELPLFGQHAVAAARSAAGWRAFDLGSLVLSRRCSAS